MTAQGLLVYGVTGNRLVAPPALYGSGAPGSNLNPVLGQMYFDTATTPRTGYVWNGSTWATDSTTGGSFTTLTVTGLSTLGAITQVGTANINATGTAVTNLGNATGGVVAVGNMTWATATQGPVQTAVAITGASPQIANARVFAVTFSSVSIAAGATQTLTVTNSTITGASTLIQYTIVGATSGAALTIQSVTNSAGSSAVVITNGTGATTTTADLTLIGHVLN